MTDGHDDRLRGATLAAAPMLLLGLVGAALAVATALWGAWHPDHLGVAFFATLGLSILVALAGITSAAGCFVDTTPTELRDVVGWVTVRRIPRANVVEVRVLAGAWRRFEVELDDGAFVTLIGTSPVQFPARMLPESRTHDLATLAVLRGDASVPPA